MKRAFATKVLAVVLCFTLGCGIAATTWLTEGLSIVNALLPGVANIWTLISALKGNGTVSAADLQAAQQATTEAQSDLTLIQGLITQYNTAAAADKPGILAKINSTAQVVGANLTGLLTALHIKDSATQAKVQLLITTIVSEINSLVAILPIVNPSSSPAMVRMSTKQAKKNPPLSAKDFKKSFNAVMAAKTGNPELDKATAGLVIK